MPGTRIIIALALLLVGPPALAEDRFSPLLRFVPEDALSAGVEDALMFTDVAAMREAVPMRLSLADAFSWSAEDRSFAALMRMSAAPAMLYDYLRNFSEIDRMAEYVGFAWSDVETALGFGRPPTNLVIMTGSPAVSDAETLGRVLGGRGFEAEGRGGHTIWWRFEDNRVDLASRDPADPLRGHLGGSARAGVVDGAFIASSNWAGIDLILGAVDGATPSLADSADFVALAHALNRPVTEAGLLLQAYVVDDGLEMQMLRDLMAGYAAEEVRLAWEEAMAAAGPSGTPPYSAFGFADRQESSTVVGLVALVYAERADAEVAIRTVPAAFAGQPSMAYREAFSEVLPYPIAADVVEGPGGDRFIARIAFYDPDAETLGGPADNRNRPFQTLLQMLFNGDFGPLAAD